jgi:glycosyltransferase 2 family protein
MSFRSLFKFAGAMVTLACLGYFLLYVADNYRSIAELGLKAEDLWISLLLTIPYVLAIVLAAIAWMILLRSLAVNLSLKTTYSIYGRAQFAKYLPGNVGHHVGRVWLAKVECVPVKTCLQTMLVETSLFLLIGAGLAGLAIYAFAYELPGAWGVLSGPLLLAISLTTLVMPLLIPAAARLLRSTKLPGRLAEVFELWPTPVKALQVMGLMLGCFLLNGVILWSLASFAFAESDGDLLFYLGLYAVSWFAGFVVPGAPAGLGVREAIMLAVLGPLYGSAVAIGLSVAARLVATLGDLLAFLLAAYIHSRGAPGTQPPGATHPV